MNDQNPKLVIGHWEFLIAILPALLPTYLIRFSLFGLPTNFFEVAVAVAFLIGVFQLRIRRSWREAYYSLPKPILISLFLFLLSAVLSTVISPHLETSLGILKSWVILPMIFGWMVYAGSTAGGATGAPRQARNSSEHLMGVQAATGPAAVVKALILSGLVVALLGLSQLGTLDRIRGPYDVPNSLALFLAPLTVLSALRMTRYSLLAATIMFAALLFTQSLAGVLSVLIVLVFGLPLVARRAKWGHWSFIAAALVIIAVILGPKVEYLQQPGSSAYVRLQLWSLSWDLIKEHPILGLGLGTFEPFYQQKLHERFARPASAGQPAPLAEFVFRDPHNWLLSFWLNLGLLGLLSFTTIHVYILFKFFLPLTKGESPEPQAVQGVGVVFALITLLLFGLFDTIYWKNDLAALHFLLVSLALLQFLTYSRLRTTILHHDE